jgi:hypothetical protein
MTGGKSAPDQRATEEEEDLLPALEAILTCVDEIEEGLQQS